MNIGIFAGELSGDLLGGALALELRRLCPDATLWGLGSGAMRAAGVELLADSESWSSIGVSEAVGKIPALLLKIAPLVRQAVAERHPDVVVLIDFGAFNVRLARYAKRLGLRVFYYFPPGSWQRYGERGANLREITDQVATPFTWSAERLSRLGVNAVATGHALVDRVRPVMSRADFAAQFGMDAAHPIVGLLPGSRRHEVAHLMPALLSAARLMYQRLPNAQFVLGVAPSLSPELIARYLAGHTELRDRLSEIWHEFAQEAETKVWKRVKGAAGVLSPQRKQILVTSTGVLLPAEALEEESEARRRSEQMRARAAAYPPPTVLAKGLTYDVMAHSDVLLVCSGTATLEATVFLTPMVILYRGSRLLELEYKLRGLHKKITHIGLPNILADRRIVPELIQTEATPEAIAEQALTLLQDVGQRHQMKMDLLSVRATLGEPGASARAAALVLQLAETPSSSGGGVSEEPDAAVAGETSGSDANRAEDVRAGASPIHTPGRSPAGSAEDRRRAQDG